VGRIAERIAMNEFEARGFDIIDLAYMSKTIANVDFIATKRGRTINVQVKGMTNAQGKRWTVQYGYCDEAIIKSTSPHFNCRPDAALKADVVVLLAVRSPSDYRAFVMPIDSAEEAAQLNISGYYRQPKGDGGVRQPGKIWLDVEPAATPRKQDKLKDQERSLILRHENAWEAFGDLP
jgi:Holliday junction resolvase-like predicted endonuclease